MSKPSPLIQKAVKDFSRFHSFYEKKIDKDRIKKEGEYYRIEKFLTKKERSLLRRSALKKVLKKKSLLFCDNKNEKKLLTENIKKYYGQDIPKEKIKNITASLEKYCKLISQTELSGAKKEKYNCWIFSLAACEIEDLILGKNINDAITRFLFLILSSQITTDNKIRHKNSTIYIAVEKFFFDIDNDLITYRYLKRKYKSPKNKEWKIKNYKKFYYEKDNIAKILTSPFLRKTRQALKTNGPIYFIIAQLLQDEKKKIKTLFISPQKTQEKITTKYNRKMKEVFSQIFNISIDSIIIITLATIIIFLLKIITLTNIKDVTATNLILISSHAIIPLFAISFFAITNTSFDKKKNKKRALLKTMEIFYKKDLPQINIKTLMSKNTSLLFVIINTFYTLSSAVLFAFLAIIFNIVGFPLFLSITFSLSLSFTAFVCIKIENILQEINFAKQPEETKLDIIFKLIALPFILTNNKVNTWKKDSNFIILKTSLFHPLDFLKEARKTTVNFLYEKKEKLYQ